MSSVADRLQPVVRSLLGDDPPVAVRFWDDSIVGRRTASTSIVVRSPVALRHLLWGPGELGLARAYVVGALDIEGDVLDVLRLRDEILERGHDGPSLGPLGWIRLVASMLRLGILGLRPPRPEEEVVLKGSLHSKVRDAAAISHHYDVSNEFYRLVLGESMTYSCAYWPTNDMTLDQAQGAKHALVGAKLNLQPGMRLLDVGCGWGGMVID
ncbi:MAG: class I SAM-dependent methyltransferase, partial [Actinomycetota bacterium]|nr:class I SAM-dependent methyltransferase [Actinomycetota bacterium]